MRNILEHPTIKEMDVRNIHRFYEILLFNIESLWPLESLNKLDAAIRFTFDKLGVIKNELAMIDEQWSEWSFTKFLEALKKWTLNNPLSEAPRSNLVIKTRRPPVVGCFAKAQITMQSIAIRS